MIIRIKCAINAVCLNHPETILLAPTPPPHPRLSSMGNVSSTKPGAKKDGDHCPRPSRVRLKPAAVPHPSC